MNKRLLSMFLALCMIVSMLPVSAMAEEIHTTIGGSREIISFAPLTETEKAVSLGTSIEDLELPETLTAMVRTAVPTAENPTQNSGSPETATPTTATEPEWVENTMEIPVTWDSPDYDPNTGGEYIFSPIIMGYTVKTALPHITVTMGETLPIAAAREIASPLSATTYNIWVGGVQVTDANKDDVLDAANYEGAIITYDPDTSTLTLDNATINAAYNGTWIDSVTTAYYGIYADNALKIEMVGNSTVIGKNQSGSASIGIYTGGTLNLSGSGSLHISGGTGKFSIGIYSAGSIAIEGGRVTAAGVAATQTSMAIASNGDITISNEGVEASADTSALNSFGMIATDGVAINNGEVTASGKTGLHTNAAEGPVTVSDGRLTANGSLVGIAGALTVTGGTVTVKSDTKALDGSLTTSGYTGCTVTAGANKNGDGAGTYNASSLASYKYIKVEAADTPPVILISDRTALQSAIDGATGDLNLKLSESYSGTGMVKIPDSWIYNITIDLNGKMLDGNYDNAILHGGGGVLSITDSKGGGIVTSKTTIGTIRANNGSKVNISGGTVSATGSNGYAIFSANAILNISGGTVSATGINGYAIYSTNTYAQLNISGGTISTVNGTAIYFTNTTILTGGTVVIQGGTKAMVFVPTLDGGVQGGASTSYDGSSSVAYVAENIAIYKYLKFGDDVISPVLSSGSVNRTSDTAASIDFTTDKAGTAYYLVKDSSVSAPTSAEVKESASLGAVSAGAVTNQSVTLTAGAKNIYVVVEDSADNISTPLKIEAAAYVAPADTTAPTITSVSVPGNGTYSAGNNLVFTVIFDENVNVNTASGIPYLSLIIGSTSRQATYVSGSGTSNLAFRYTVQVGNSDSDGISIGSLILNGGTIQDGAGNNANLTLNSVGNMTGVLVDTSVAPSITGQPSSQTVNAGQNATFSVTATGTGITYQWQVDTSSGFTNITSGGVYSGASTSTLTITGVTAGMNGYQYRAIVSGTVAPVATSNPAMLTVTAAPSYTITANPTAKDFGSLSVGYTAPAVQTVTITNTGNSSVTLTQPTSTNYTIGTLSDTTLDANGTATFTVTTKVGLAVGNYNETLTVSTDHSTNATVELSFSVTAVPTYTVTFNPNGGTISETSRSVALGTAVGTLPIPTRSGRYSFDGWYTAASGGTQIFASTTISANVTYYAHWTYTSGGGSGSGSGSSSNDNSSPVIVTPPAPDKPNSPTQGEIKVSGTVDSKGAVTVNISDKTVTDAFEKALTDAKKNSNEQNGITVILRVDTGSKTGSHVTVNLPKTVQDTIIEKKIVNTIVVVDNPDIRIGMDLATVQEINKQAKSDVNITATRGDSSKLTGDAKKAIGSRPVFDLKVNYGNGKAVSSFGAGSVSVTIPYTLGTNENIGNVQAVYADAKGKVHWLTKSVYDSVAQVLRFSTDHFSTYGIGYKQTNTAFTDIAGHWAKGDIEFVVSRGLFSGTSETKFSPNTAMTRGMFVTALGTLANADVSGYTKSSFTDVKADAYYMGYIEWASKNSIVNGTGNGKFAPDQSITREQMAVIMGNYAKTIGYTLPKVHIENIFTDNAKINTYAKEAVKHMQMAGVISGKNGNLFDPQGTATRAEVSAVLRRFVELAISSDTAQGWFMNDSGKWMYFKDGKPLTGKQDIDGATYTFDEYGVTADVPKNLRYTTYTVQKGDSFWLISRKLGCTMAELEQLNNRSRYALIFPGEVFRVPQR